MVLKWYQTIDTLCSSEMRAMMSLTNNHNYLNADTVKWINPLAFTSKYNSNYNSTWDEDMDCPHKEVYWLSCYK